VGNAFDDRVELGFHFSIRKSQDFEALFIQVSSSHIVVILAHVRICMLRAVDLNHERAFVTEKVGDEFPNRTLPAKLQPFDLPPAQLVPKQVFRWRLISPQHSSVVPHPPRHPSN
jgi:hypothetical protein